MKRGFFSFGMKLIVCYCKYTFLLQGLRERLESRSLTRRKARPERTRHKKNASKNECVLMPNAFWLMPI